MAHKVSLCAMNKRIAQSQTTGKQRSQVSNPWYSDAGLSSYRDNPGPPSAVAHQGHCLLPITRACGQEPSF